MWLRSSREDSALFAAATSGRDRIVVMLTDQTDWVEIGELVTESYRMIAPRKLTALLAHRRGDGL